jgi:phosphoglycolate phosphatase-like HAD superfamily hydrolase
MKAVKSKYIFFDFDGTISDARRLTYETMIEVLDKIEYEFSRLKLKKLMGSKIHDILGGLDVHESLYDKLRKKFYEYLLNNVNKKNLRLCVDVKPLYLLKNNGFKLIIVSNAEKSFIDASIKILGLQDLFSEIYGGESFSTKDEILKKLIKKYDLNPHKCFYIGDRFSDISSAHRAHMTAVAIHNKYSWSTKDEILSEKPDFIINDFSDLQKIIDSNKN